MNSKKRVFFCIWVLLACTCAVIGVVGVLSVNGWYPPEWINATKLIRDLSLFVVVGNALLTLAMIANR